MLEAVERVVAVIPARAGSTRLPHKPLVLLGKIPLIVRVWRRASRCTAFDAVWVTTDDSRIQALIEAEGGQVVRIDAPCTSGTDRVARALEKIDATYVINLQGDEPFVDLDALSQLVAALRAGAAIATLAAPRPVGALQDRSAVKVVCDAQGHAMYFSRAAIPGDLHLGVYGFTREALLAVAHLPRGPLATAEDLEQLAWLEAGWPIAVVPAAQASLSIDTPTDLAAAEQLLSSQRRPR